MKAAALRGSFLPAHHGRWGGNWGCGNWSKSRTATRRRSRASVAPRGDNICRTHRTKAARLIPATVSAQAGSRWHDAACKRRGESSRRQCGRGLGGFMMLGLAIGMAGSSLTCAAKAADYYSGLPGFFPKYSVASSRPMMAAAITAGVRISCRDKPRP
jgi:hypothetical protein